MTPTALEVLLLILLSLNAYAGRWTIVGVIVAGVTTFRAVSACYWRRKLGREKTSAVKIVRLSRERQRILMSRLADECPQTSSTEKRVKIEVPGGTGPSLEGVLCRPITGKDALKTNADTAFLLTHPWAPLGGDMDNNVPSELARTLAAFGYTTLRFNFRGVGGSKGCCTWRGHGERQDVSACCQWLLHHLPDDGEATIKNIILCGYSYGSMISNYCGEMHGEVRAIVSIATPFSCYWGLSLFNCRKFLRLAHSSSKPKLFICGDCDEFTGPSLYRRSINEFPGGNKEAFLVEGVDHGFWGAEMTAAFVMLRFLRSQGIIPSPADPNPNPNNNIAS